MKILMASSEMAPLARTGGLGDVLAALPSELQQRGHEVSVALPFYRGIRENKALKAKRTGVTVTIQIGAKRHEAEILQCTAPNGVQVFLVRRDEYFDRSGLYGADGRDYEDNAERFIFFSKAVVELARRVTPPPDVLHVHDWQTGLIPVFVKEWELPFSTVFTVHNLAYQGSFWAVDFGLTNLPAGFFSPRGVEFYGRLNFLKSGILFADAVTTVSERYAREIQTAEFGCGLDGVLRENAGKLRGILNGTDYTLWDPATDKLIAKKYKAESLAGKKVCRDALLEKVGLKENPRGPVFGMVTRLAEQKGIDLMLPLIDRLLADDVRLMVLGEGDTAYERELMIAQKKHGGKFAFQRGHDEPLSHAIEAGSDITLIPSHFEPCGLTAQYSLRYGTIPIARACGGLYQIIRDYDPSAGAGTGFVFFDYTAEALWDAIGRAKRVFQNADEWKALMQRAMACEFSWAKAAAEYEKVYDWLARGRAPAAEPGTPA
jgi:starch synthase